jgi:hypothetical protein
MNQFPISGIVTFCVLSPCDHVRKQRGSATEIVACCPVCDRMVETATVTVLHDMVPDKVLHQQRFQVVGVIGKYPGPSEN